jgi:hypothetical protein
VDRQIAPRHCRGKAPSVRYAGRTRACEHSSTCYRWKSWASPCRCRNSRF